MIPSSPTAAADGEVTRLAVLFAVLYFVQGVGEPTAGLIAQPVRSILKSWGESPASIATFAALMSIPWTLKPLYGLISDFIPLWGSRRRSYLLLTSLLAIGGFFTLYAFRPAPGNYAFFLVLLVAPTVAIACGDVLVDALMVEKGQPRGATGFFQSVQWTASYVATLLTGVVGGYLSQQGHEAYGFLLCGGLAVVTFALAWLWVKEEPRPAGESFRQTLAALGQAARSPTLLGVAAFLFVWNLDPLSNTVVYLHITEQMGWSEQFYGTTLSLLGLGCIVGSVSYGIYCRHVSVPVLAHGAVLLGVMSQAAYWTMDDRGDAVAVHLVVGFTWMTASMVQLDLAARVCPPHAAATVFAVLMALSNLASSLGEWLGGTWYESLLREAGGAHAFAVIVGLGVACKASCWLLFVLQPSRWNMR
jgi:predicted MFS family arabinose efflux permease